MPAVTSRAEPDDTEIEEMRVTVPHTVTHVLLGRRTYSLSRPLAVLRCAGRKNMLSFLCAPQPSLFSPLTVTLQYFSMAITGDCGGSSPPHHAASQPGVTACQGTVSL